MRTSKYNSTTRAKVLTLIADGRTVKDTCKLVGISDMTLTRWRRRFPDFDADYLKAVEKQWMNLEATKRSGAKTYKRNTAKLRQRAEKEAKTQKTEQAKQKAKNSGKPLVVDGLRVRYGSIAEDHPLEPCIAYYNGAVEYLKWQDGRHIQFSLSLDVFKRSHPAWYRQLAEQNSALDVGD